MMQLKIIAKTHNYAMMMRPGLAKLLWDSKNIHIFWHRNLRQLNLIPICIVQWMNIEKMKLLEKKKIYIILI